MFGGMLALLIALCAEACIAAYPERPIRVVVPVPPGGAIDIVGRLFGQKMAEVFGQSVVIDNRGGANGIIGTDIVARAASDGYTLLTTSGSHTINPSVYRKLPYDTLRDFAPISQLATTGGSVLVVHPSFAARSVQQLIELARAHPGKFVYGSPGVGNIQHLAGEMFNAMAGVRLTHVPYKGAGPALNDLLGGQIPIMFPSSANAIPLVKAGRLVGLAVTGRARAPQLPDVPTMDEAGLKGYEVSSWFGLYAPARTPRGIVVTLYEAVRAAVQSAEVRERLAGFNYEPVGSSPDAFAAFLREDLAKYARVVKAAGIVAQ